MRSRSRSGARSRTHDHADPLAVLRRIRRDAARCREPRAGERCELCAEPIRRSTTISSTSSSATSCARAAAAGCSSRRRAPAAGTSGRCRTVRRVPRPAAVAGPVGRAADPGERGVLLRELDARSRRRVLSRAPRARPSRCSRSTRGTSSPPRTPSWPRSSPTSRRSSCALDERRPRASAILVPIDACYELVGRLRTLWRGFDGGQEAHDALDAFFDDVRARAR